MFDFITDSSPVEFKRTPAGFLKGKAKICQPGVFDYKGIGVVRKDSDVFDSNFIDSLNNMVVTAEHPIDASGKKVKITPENARDFQVGMTSNARVEADVPVVDIVVTDSASIERVEKEGIVEISLGFESNRIKEAGSFRGKEFTEHHTNMIGNHLAITKEGRLGAKFGIVADSKINTQDEIVKDKIKIGGIEFEVDSMLAQAYNKQESDRKLVTDSIEPLQADNKKLKEENEDLKKKITDFDSTVDALVIAKADIMALAKKYEIDTKDKSDVDLKKEVIAKAGLTIEGDEALVMDSLFANARTILGKQAEDNPEIVIDSKTPAAPATRTKEMEDAGITLS